MPKLLLPIAELAGKRLVLSANQMADNTASRLFKLAFAHLGAMRRI
ncbi:MAG: hypothetical protein H6943_08755 [Zoogloeaceae bacterium]|nr:hypothetical protein [Zoogloeaceae bacterium]